MSAVHHKCSWTVAGETSRVRDMTRRLVISVDLDEWYHCRWATGSDGARWRTPLECFQEYYGSDRPIGELIPPTQRVLDLFSRYGIRATFFVLGEVAEWYPDLIRRIHARGHEIACHGMHHVDLFWLDHAEFQAQLRQAKAILEDLIGEPVVGYRAPNLIIASWVIPILEELGLRYDSSVCGSRSLMGKFNNMKSAPLHPYFPAPDNVARPGSASILEIPIPYFPGLRLPGGSGIMTRIAGRWWAQASLEYALNQGDTIYYFHPYELGPAPKLPGLGVKERVFLRRVGSWYECALETLIRSLSVEFVTAGELARAMFRSRVGVPA